MALSFPTKFDIINIFPNSRDYSQGVSERTEVRPVYDNIGGSGITIVTDDDLLTETFSADTGAIDHNGLLNTHNLTTDIDHNSLTNYAANRHFLESSIDLDNVTEGTTNKFFTATEETKLAGIETGAEVNNISDVNATDLTDGGETSLHTHAGTVDWTQDQSPLVINAANYVDNDTTDHTSLSNIGTNTHAQIDTAVTNSGNHIAAANPHSGHVDTTGDETIAGIKTFSSFPVTPSSAPTTDYQAANKKYVDDNTPGTKAHSIIAGGYKGNNIFGDNDTWYSYPNVGGHDDVATVKGLTSETEGEVEMIMPIAGTLQNLYADLETNSLSHTTTLTIRKNGSDTALTVNWTTTQTGTKSDTGNTVNVSAGDRISVKQATGTGSGSAEDVRWAFEVA
ncbi:MAG: hypothetical protein CMI54_01855 [Parcubacteria group bacterium]|nr:hypothetical protein [Parcubacteria group bacterium]|tara:strand:+ start:2705 stop:3889 length:1185 start_codon:yes stop_codon:yes gene_type:complete